MESRFLEPSFFSNLPITRTKSRSLSSDKHCNFTPRFLELSDFSNQLAFPLEVREIGIPLYRIEIKWNPDFWNLQGKRKLVQEIGEFEKSESSRNRRVREIGGKITVFDRGEGTTFGSSYREVRKNEGSRNRDSTVIVFYSMKLFY